MLSATLRPFYSSASSSDINISLANEINTLHQELVEQRFREREHSETRRFSNSEMWVMFVSHYFSQCHNNDENAFDPIKAPSALNQWAEENDLYFQTRDLYCQLYSYINANRKISFEAMWFNWSPKL